MSQTSGGAAGRRGGGRGSLDDPRRFEPTHAPHSGLPPTAAPFHCLPPPHAQVFDCAPGELEPAVRADLECLLAIDRLLVARGYAAPGDSPLGALLRLRWAGGQAQTLRACIVVDL